MLRKNSEPEGSEFFQYELKLLRIILIYQSTALNRPLETRSRTIADILSDCGDHIGASCLKYESLTASAD